jgi:hypothetical protein
MQLWFHCWLNIVEIHQETGECVQEKLACWVLAKPLAERDAKKQIGQFLL